MAEEKTEKATPKKRRDERKEGHVFSSKDVIAVASLLGCFYSLQALFPSMYRSLREFMITFLAATQEVGAFDYGILQEIGWRAVILLAKLILPFGFIAIAIAVIATGVQTKFLFTGKAAAFKLKNLNPLKGIKNLFSMKNVVELIKSIIKIIVLAIVLYQLLSSEIVSVAQMTDLAPEAAFAYTLKEVMGIVLKVGMLFAAIAGFDYFYQWYAYEKQIKMSKQEIKEEFKQTEGNPEIKGRIRNLQRSMARNRMMQAVPDADVIIRNPTHYAVALKYDIDHDNAPILIAKGADRLALKIIEIGEANGVSIIENRPLARGIYATTPLECEIPAEYYGVVAEILVQVFRMNKKME